MFRKRGDESESVHDGDTTEQQGTPGYYPGFHVLDQQNFWDAATREIITNRVKHIPPIRFFDATEAAVIMAAVARVLPQEDRPQNLRIPVFPFIDARLFLNHIDGYRYDDMPSDQDAYRLAAKALSAMAEELHGKPFPTLTPLQQETILQSLHDAEPLAAKELWQQMNIKRFWSMFVSDCCAVYYAHPLAWDEIGFGGPAYPRGYMRLEGGEAEPWEVAEKRHEWQSPSGISDQLQQISGLHETPHRGQAGVR